MASASPAFQFYPKDFLTDVKQIAMSLAEVGAYWRLCCHCWLEGSLPTEPKKLARLCGATSRQLNEMWPAIGQCFVERDGVLVHKRLEREREKQETYRRRQSDKGKASAKMREVLKASTERQPESNQNPTAVEPDGQPKPNSSSSSPISNLQTAVIPLDVRLERFLREHYPPSGYQCGWEVEQAWIAVFDGVDADTRYGELVAGVTQHKLSAQWLDGKIPLFGRWLREKRWNQRLQEPAAESATGESAEQILARWKAAK